MVNGLHLHSPFPAHIHTPTAESATQGDSQLVWSSQGEASRSGTPRYSRDWTSNLPIISQPALPPDPRAIPKWSVVWPFLSCLCSPRRRTNAIHYETNGCPLQHVVKHTPSYLGCGRWLLFLLWWTVEQTSFVLAHRMHSAAGNTRYRKILHNITCMLYVLAFNNGT